MRRKAKWLSQITGFPAQTGYPRIRLVTTNRMGLLQARTDANSRSYEQVCAGVYAKEGVISLDTVPSSRTMSLADSGVARRPGGAVQAGGSLEAPGEPIRVAAQDGCAVTQWLPRAAQQEDRGSIRRSRGNSPGKFVCPDLPGMCGECLGCFVAALLLSPSSLIVYCFFAHTSDISLFVLTCQSPSHL